MIPLAKKESESSWFVTLLKLICIMIMGVGGLYTVWNLVNHVPATNSKKGGRRSRRKRNEHEDSQPRGRNQEGKKLDPRHVYAETPQNQLHDYQSSVRQLYALDGDAYTAPGQQGALCQVGRGGRVREKACWFTVWHEEL